MSKYTNIQIQLGIHSLAIKTMLNEFYNTERNCHNWTIRKQYNTQLRLLRIKDKHTHALLTMYPSLITMLNPNANLHAELMALYSNDHKGVIDYYSIPLEERNEKYKSIVRYLQGLNKTKQLHFLNQIVYTSYKG